MGIEERVWIRCLIWCTLAGHVLNPKHCAASLEMLSSFVLVVMLLGDVIFIGERTEPRPREAR